MERTTKQTTAKRKVRRRISVRNLGWATSWGLFFCTFVQMVVTACVTIQTGTNPIDDDPWVLGLWIVIVIWTGYRNPVGPLEYMSEWKRKRNRKG